MRIVRAEAEKLEVHEYHSFFKVLDVENNWFSNMVSLVYYLYINTVTGTRRHSKVAGEAV